MKKLFILLFALQTGQQIAAQPTASEIDIKGITDTIQLMMKEEKITGLMLGITTKDSVLFSGGFGYADAEAGRKADEVSMFRLGSISKMFISAAILKLVQEGKLSLNDDLKKVAPDVPFQNKWESTHPVKIRHLLEHTAGFDDIKLNRFYSLDTIENAGKPMMLLYKGSMVSRWKPGERHAYSNPGYTILGYIIEKKTGTPFDAYIAREFFHPLGMKNSNFNLRRKHPDDVAEYAVISGESVKIPSVTVLSGAPGALWSSSSEMVKFIQFLLNNGNPVLGESMINQMETVRTPIVNTKGIGFGYALGNENNNFPTAKYPMYGHNGLTGSCYSSLRYNRELGIGFIISSNSNYSGRKIEEFVVRKLQENFPNPEVETEPLAIEPLKPFLGFYVLRSPRHVISSFADELQFAPRLFLKDSVLFFKPLMGDPLALVQMGKGIFTFKNCNIPLIAFEKNDKGKNVMRLGGSYFVQQNFFIAAGYRLAVFASIIVAISIFLFLPAIIVRAIKGKLNPTAMWMSLIVAVGIIGLISAIVSLLHTQTYTFKLYEFGTINFRTLTIFLGTILFGVSAIASVVHRVNILRKNYPVIYKWYYSSLSLCLLFLFFILLINGWIGLRF